MRSPANLGRTPPEAPLVESRPDMAGKPLRSQLNQIRAWVQEGRTDAWGRWDGRHVLIARPHAESEASTETGARPKNVRPGPCDKTECLFDLDDSIDVCVVVGVEFRGCVSKLTCHADRRHPQASRRNVLTRVPPIRRDRDRFVTNPHAHFATRPSRHLGQDGIPGAGVSVRHGRE